MFECIRRLFRKPSVEFISLRTTGWDNDRAGIWSSNGIEDLSVTITDENGNDIEKAKDLRKAVEPVAILHLLERPIQFKEMDIKAKIKEVKRRIEFLNRTRMSSNAEERVLEMLEARLDYPRYAHLFAWKTTTPEKVEALLKEYQLKHDNVDRYVRRIPERAVTEMERFESVWRKVNRKSQPVFSIIAPEGDFKKDPILLAKSPFGAYFYILCAWDKEISIVDELLEEEMLEKKSD